MGKFDEAIAEVKEIVYIFVKISKEFDQSATPLTKGKLYDLKEWIKAIYVGQFQLNRLSVK